METSVEWVLCGDIYVGRSCVGYRQIPVDKMKGCTLEEGRYRIEIEDYESFEELEVAQTMSSLERQRYQHQRNRMKNMTAITVDLDDLDSYFAKRKDLREKHTTALFTLKEYAKERDQENGQKHV